MGDWTIRRIVGAQGQPTEARLLSVTLGTEYDARQCTDFHGPEEVEAFMRDLEREKRVLWPKKAGEAA